MCAAVLGASAAVGRRPERPAVTDPVVLPGSWVEIKAVSFSGDSVSISGVDDRGRALDLSGCVDAGPRSRPELN